MLMSPRAIIKTMWKIYTENFMLFARVTAWGLLPAAALAATALTEQLVGTAFYNTAVILYLAFSALSALIVIWIQLVLIRLIQGSETHESIDIKAIQTQSWRDIVSYFWVSVLVGLVIAVGLIAFVIPGIIFAVWFAFATTIFALHGVKGRAALTQSKVLVAGRWWKVLWRVVVPYAFYLFLVGIGVALLETLFGAPTAWKELQTYAGPWWSSLAESIPSLLFMPLGLAVLVTVLRDLEMNKIEMPAKTSTPPPTV